MSVIRIQPELLAPAGRLALERQHIKCQGRTPEATMASALYTDVKRKGSKSVFTRRAPVPAVVGFDVSSSGLAYTRFCRAHVSCTHMANLANRAVLD